MSRFVLLAAFVLVTVLPTPASANVAQEAARDIVETMRQKQELRWGSISEYVVDEQNVQRSVLLYERVSGAGGGFRLVPPPEINERLELIAGLVPETKQKISQGVLFGGFAIIGGEALNALPEDTLNDLAAFFGIYRGTYKNKPDAGETSSDARLAARHLAEFAEVAELQLAGTEELDGRQAFRLVADDLGRVQRTTSGEFTLQSVEAWIDSTEYVQLGLRMEGVLRSGKQERAVTILRRDSDFRRVKSLYEPFRRTVAIRGLLDAKQSRELKDLQKQLAEQQESKKKFDQDLAKLSEDQKALILKKLAPQLAMLEQLEAQIEQMARDNEIAMETIVHEIRVGGIAVYVEMLLAALGVNDDPPATDASSSP